MKMLLSGIIKIRWSLKENPRFFTKTVTIFPTLLVVYLIKVEMNKFSEKLIFDWTVVANQGCTYLFSEEAQMRCYLSWIKCSVQFMATRSSLKLGQLPHAYSNPNYEQQQPRVQGRVTFGHRRTPSGSSANYQYDHDRSGPSSSEYSDRHDRQPPLVPRRLSRQGSYGNEVRTL